MFAELRRNGTFQMRNFLSGFDGTWKVEKGHVRITITDGPAGKLKKPDSILLKPQPDRRRLVVVHPKATAGQLEFRFDPTIRERVRRRMQEIWEEMHPTVPSDGVH
jgi:hypothetical protein